MSSIDAKKPKLDYDDLCNRLIKIYKKKIITVCLYYSDYKNKKIVNIFKKKGFKVITIVSREKNKSLENKVMNILVENQMKDKIKLFGRTEHMVSVIFNGNKKNIGKIVQVKINTSNQNSLFGTIIETQNKKVA